jgi:Domain of unknown function (DUF3943)
VPTLVRPVAAVALTVLLGLASAAGSNEPGQYQGTVPEDAPASIEFRLAPAGDLEPLFGMTWGRSPGRSKPSRPGNGPKRGRAWIEWGAFVTFVTVQYWTSNSFPEDRDFKLTLGDQVRRIAFLDGVRFDSNQFSLNWSHILGGAMYYQFGRTNNLSWPASWLMAFVGSTWWEVIGEPKEVISINDQILTGAGGFPLGEAWFQVGNFLLHRPHAIQRALGVANPVLLINHWLDRKDPAGRTYVQPGWHDFSLVAGGRRLSAAGVQTGTDLYFGVRARLIGLPEYGRPGEVRRPLRDTYISELDFDYATRGGHAEETRLYAKAVPWGRLIQKISPDGRGYCLTLGLGSSFEYFKKRPLADYDAVPVPVKTDLDRLRLGEPRAFTDKLAIVHLVGPVLDGTVFRRGLTFRAGLEASFDFALVNATAINDYSRLHDITGLKTTVFYYGYYYGLGGTLAARARLEAGVLSVHGLAEYNAWGSVDALDRFQAEITDNAHLGDTRTRLLVGASLRLPRTPVKLFAEIESVRRSGRLAEVRSVVRETKAYAGLAFSF